MNQTWDTDFEDLPSNGEALSSAPVMWANFTEGIRERFDNEHEMGVDTNNSIHGRHDEGSFVGFAQSTCPLQMSDGRYLSDVDSGLLWMDTKTKTVYFYGGGDASSPNSAATRGWCPISDSDSAALVPVGSTTMTGARSKNDFFGFLSTMELSAGVYPFVGLTNPDVVANNDFGWCFALRYVDQSNVTIYYYDVLGAEQKSYSLVDNGTGNVYFWGNVPIPKR